MSRRGERPDRGGEAGGASDMKRDADMTVYERTLIRALIREAAAVLAEHGGDDGDERRVAAFLDRVPVEAAEVLRREVLRRGGAGGEQV